ncbi:MAG: hypothetical protein HY744_27700 [Deltaproteobacteria bacterium]|nr:hypothetical protein [Deltaproteobacteria bacterium]
MDFIIHRRGRLWGQVLFPYWWNNLVCALDVVARIDPPGVARPVAEAVAWLHEHQLPSGLWRLSYSGLHRARDSDRTRAEARWVSLAICRVLVRLGRTRQGVRAMGANR